MSHSSDLSVDCSVLESLNQNQQSVIPKFPPQNSLDVPDISVLNSVMSTSENTFSTDTVTTSGTSDVDMYPGSIPHQSELMARDHQPLLTISQSQVTSQLGFHTTMKQGSPATSNSTSSPSRESSDDSDDSVPLAQVSKWGKHLKCLVGGGFNYFYVNFNYLLTSISYQFFFLFLL